MDTQGALDFLQKKCCVPNSLFLTDEYQVYARSIEALKEKLEREKGGQK